MARKSLTRVEQPIQRRTITVVTDAFINNLDVLGATHELGEDLELRFHRHPQVNFRGDKVSFNFDIMISNGGTNEGFNFKHVLPEHRYVHLPRYDKFTQAIRLLNGFNEYKQLNKDTHDHYRNWFHPVPTWFVGLNPTRSFPTVKGKVVVKPMDGARGVGHFVVDLDYVNLTQFNKVLARYVAGEHDEAKFKVMLDSFEGHVTYHSIDEDHPGEGLQALTEQGAIVQSFVPDVAAEYRVITGKDGLPVYYQRRKMRDVDSKYPQATGGGNLISAAESGPTPFLGRPDEQAIFDYLCQYVIGPLNSIDLFITRGDEWGIFEYCNQFGVSGISAKTAENIHADFIKEVVVKFLEAETPSATVTTP